MLSPGKNINASYIHLGIGTSTPSAIPITVSYGFGVIKNLNTKADYSEHFLNIGVSGIFGFDYGGCPDGSSSYSFTIGNSYGIYGGYDYYCCLD